MRGARAQAALMAAVLLAQPAAGASRGREGAKRGAPPAPGVVSSVGPIEPGVKSERQTGWTRWEASLPGEVLDEAWPKGPHAGGNLLLLVRPGLVTAERAESAEGAEDAGGDAVAPVRTTEPLELWRLVTEGEGKLDRLRQDLPGDATLLDAFDLDGDGRDEVLLARPGAMLALRAGDDNRWTGPARPLITDPGLSLRAWDTLAPTSVTLGTSPPRMCAGLLGALRCWEPSAGDAGDAPWAVAQETNLPVQARRDREALRLSGVRVQTLSGASGAPPVFAAGPQPVGKERVRSLLIDPAAPEASRQVECWSRLPHPERIVDHAYLRMDGRPMMLVTTTEADALSLFGEKRLRLFALEADRTRTGRPPVLAAETRMNLWQEAHPTVLDANGDGREDLVLGYWKGLKDDRVVLDAYLRKPDGSFEASPRSTAFDVEDGNRGVLQFGRDLDGDRIPDLLLIAGSAVQLYPGATGGKELVRKTPRFTVPLGSSVNLPGGEEISLVIQDSHAGMSLAPSVRLAPRLVDLDADGRPEVIVPARRGGTVGPLVVVRFDVPKG